MPLYKIIYPFYRIEAENLKQAKLYANNAIEENLHLIRIEEDRSKEGFLKRIITGK